MDQAERLRNLVEIKNKNRRSFRVITVSSGKGGVGKTNFVVNLAVALQMRGLRVGILDADLGMANVDILFGVKSYYSIYDILYKGKRIEEVSVTSDEGIKIIPGGSGLKELSELDSEKRARLLSELSRFEDVDILLVDTGAGLSPVVLNFAEVADDVIVITNPEPTALTDAYGLIKVILKNNINGSIGVVINRVQNIVEARETFNKLSKTIEVFLNRKIKYLGYIGDDPKVGHAVREQRPFYILYPKTEASICINRISSELLGIESPASNGSVKDYFNKLLKIMGR